MGKRLGEYIKGIRKERKLAVKSVAEKSGISKSYIDYIESGLREPSPEMLAKLAVTLDIPLDKLLEIQQQESLQKAAVALAVSQSDLEKENADIRVVARAGKNNTDIDEEALKKVKLAFKFSSKNDAIIESIENPDLRAILRASEQLSVEEISKLRKVMESLYPDAFKK